MKKLSIMVFFISSTMISAQNVNLKRTWHWYFGAGAGINFSNGIASIDSNGLIFTSEGSASISDTSGGLLFYSDGKVAWNRNHQIMPNGIGLLGGNLGSSSQGALIIPKPLSSNLFYLFTTDESENGGSHGLRFSIVDMNLDGGNGDIDSNFKNLLLFGPCSEKLAAINHCNDTNVWVMGHEINNNNFRAYLITSSGIDTNAIISSIGFPMLTSTPQAIAGGINFSPNGKMLVTGSDFYNQKVEIYQFDNNTGVVHDLISIATQEPFAFGRCFSPNSKKLYSAGMGRLYQYDLNNWDSTIIQNSKILVGNNGPYGGYISLQNGADGKIYINHDITNDSLLSVINNPNDSGINCNLNLLSVHLNRQSKLGLSNFNQSYYNSSITNCTGTEVHEYKKIYLTIFPNPTDDWLIVRGNFLQSIEINDMLGKNCFKMKLNNNSSAHINLSNIDPGIYLISLISDQLKITKKIIIN